jgi:deoxyribose-phosphate aldolase
MSEERKDTVAELLQRLARAASRKRIRPKAERDVLASFIDHTLLRADATPAQIERLCREALEHSFAAVCVNGMHVRRSARLLKGQGVAVCTVAGFPLGATTTTAKLFETVRALEDGADEVDAVIPIGALLAGEEAYVAAELEALARACHAGGGRLKAILECALLDHASKLRACELAREAGCDFVKTSTGFAPGGATVEDVRLLRGCVGEALEVKAAGGIRDLATARALIEAGASRLGCSASLAIVAEAQAAGPGQPADEPSQA